MTEGFFLDRDDCGVLEAGGDFTQLQGYAEDLCDGGSQLVSSDFGHVHTNMFLFETASLSPCFGLP